jgi:predicted dehydrogenase
MLNVGIIGAGLVVQGAHVKAFEARGDARVTAIADPSEEYRSVVGRRLNCSKLHADYQRVLDDPDIQALDVCLPHFMHEKVVLEALDAGKDILLEKPIALTLDQADRMIAAAKAKKRKFFCALNQRFYPAHAKIKEIVESGEYGAPFLALCQLVGDELDRMNAPNNWKGTWDRAGGGALIDTGTHIIDLLLWWFGRPKTVSCQWGRFIVDAPNKADDNVAVTLGYESMLVQLCVSYSCRTDPWRETKQIYFPEASLHVTMDPDKPLFIGRNREPLSPIQTPEMKSWWDGSVGAGINHWLDCFLGKASPAYGPEAARDALEAILLAYRSAKEGRVISFDEPAR